MQQVPFKKFIPGIAWFFIVLILICLPGKDIPDVDLLNQISFDKFVHIGMFGVMAYLFCKPFKNKPQRNKWIIKVCLSVCIWGLVTEFIQKFFIPGRTFDMLDWLADSIGAGAVYLFLLRGGKKP